MSRVPVHFRGIKIKELREMQRRGTAGGQEVAAEVAAEVLGTRLLATRAVLPLQAVITMLTIRKLVEDEGSLKVS
jgi:hypothetical protein